MEIPEKYEPIIKELLDQLIYLDKAFAGNIPPVQLVTKENYKHLGDELHRLLVLVNDPRRTAP